MEEQAQGSIVKEDVVKDENQITKGKLLKEDEERALCGASRWVDSVGPLFSGTNGDSTFLDWVERPVGRRGLAFFADPDEGSEDEKLWDFL